MSMSGVDTRWLAVRLALASSLALAGCVLPLKGLGRGGSLSDLGSGVFANAPTGTKTGSGGGSTTTGGGGGTTTGGGGPSTDGGGTTTVFGLTGQVAAPSLELVSNNAGGLNDVGSGVYLISDNGAGLVPASDLSQNARLSTQSLVQDSIPQATIALVDSTGATISDPVLTDQSGQYQLPASQSQSQSGLAFVRATFGSKDASGDITNFSFEAPVDLAEIQSATADVDAASTLLSAKLLAAQKAGWTGSLTQTEIGTFEAELRDELSSGLLPYMGDGSPDILSTFDELVQDDATVSSDVSLLSSTLTAPTNPWQVKTLLTFTQLSNMGIYGATCQHWVGNNLRPDAVISDAGTMVVDRNGNIFLPGFDGNDLCNVGGHVTIWELPRSSTGVYATASAYVNLPADYTSPVEMAVSPAGQLYLASYNQTANTVDIYKDPGTGAGTWPWTLVASESVVNANGLSGGDKGAKMAVDSAGTIYLMRHGNNVQVIQADGTSETPFLVDPSLAGTVQIVDSLTGKPGGGAYLTDPNMNQIKSLDSNGNVLPLIGIPGDTGFQVGRAGYAHVDEPSSLVVGADGTVYMSDFNLNRVLRLSPDGSVFTVAGSTTLGHTDGSGPSATFEGIVNLALDGAGNLYVLDYDHAIWPAYGGTGTSYIREITPPGS